MLPDNMTMTAFKSTGLWIVNIFGSQAQELRQQVKSVKLQSYSVQKRKLAGNLKQSSAISKVFLSFFFKDKSINRESPKHCHFQLLNQYPTTFFDQEVEYTYNSI